jgi:MYXO-CTERM domain-containing protein
MPNGNVLVADTRSINEVTPAGQTVRRIGPTTGQISLSEIRAVAYDAEADALYLSMFDNSSTPHRLLKYRYSTAQFLAGASIMAFDITLTTDGNLLLGIGSGAAPRLYSPDLTPVAGFGGDGRNFVTQFVPEPGGLAVLGLGAIGLLRRRRR